MQNPSSHPEPQPLCPFAAIASQSLHWLWQPWLARGVLTLLDGDPELGKSTLAIELAAHVSRGTTVHIPPPPPAGPPKKPDCFWPGQEKQPPTIEPQPAAVPPPPHETRLPQGVLLLSAEDDPARATRPRLEAAGADLGRVFPLDHLPGQPERPIQLPEDVAALREIIVRHNVALVVIDPLMAFLGSGVNASSDPHVRRALHRLKCLAEETQCAVLIIRHLNKANHLKALYRGGGSIGIIGASRIALLLARDPADQGHRILAMNKCNLTAKPPSLRFHLEPRGTVAVVAWDGECAWSPDELLGKMTEQEAEEIAENLSRLDECAAFIRRQLAQGKVESWLLETLCKADGFSERTIHRARKKLGVRAFKSGFGEWWVELREEQPVPPRGPGADS